MLQIFYKKFSIFLKYLLKILYWNNNFYFQKKFMQKQSENIIEIKNLVKKYWDFEAVKWISFDVKKWEIFGFLWPNWAWKSTTIKILTTMLDKTSWEIKVDWNDLSDQHAVRNTFWIVFQDSSLDDELTWRENMYFHAMLYWVKQENIKPEIEKLMKFVELREFKDKIVKQYSWWMKRRLEMARWLLHHPKILFLDEPTVGLDPQSRTHIWEYLKKMNQEQWLTIFITTHYMDEVEKVADRVAIIDHGTIQAIGTIDELKKQTWKDNLDDVFLELTWRDIREELVSESEWMRATMQAKRRR